MGRQLRDADRRGWCAARRDRNARADRRVASGYGPRSGVCAMASSISSDSSAIRASDLARRTRGSSQKVTREQSRHGSHIPLLVVELRSLMAERPPGALTRPLGRTWGLVGWEGDRAARRAYARAARCGRRWQCFGPSKVRPNQEGPMARVGGVQPSAVNLTPPDTSASDTSALAWMGVS